MSNTNLILTQELSFLEIQYNKLTELVNRYNNIQPFDLSNSDIEFIEKEKEELSKISLKIRNMKGKIKANLFFQ